MGSISVVCLLFRKHGTVTCKIAYFRRVNDDKVTMDLFIAIKDGDLVDRDDYAEVQCAGSDKTN